MKAAQKQKGDDWPNKPTPVKVLKFDSTKAPSTTPLSSIRIATWNVLMTLYDEDIVQGDVRFPSHVPILRKLDADFIGLNEAQPQYVSRLLEDDFLTSTYNCICEQELLTGATACKTKTFGNVVLVKNTIPVSHAYLYPFALKSVIRPASLVVLDIVAKDHQVFKLALLHCHLKASEVGYETRKKQLTELGVMLGKHKHLYDELLLLGDLNIMNELDEKLINKDKYIDVWKHIYQNGDPGYTYDAQKNTLVQAIEQSDKRQMRLDRILWYRNNSKKSMMEPKSIQMFATESLNHPTYPYLFPSDHFGLLSEFTVL